MKTNIEKYGYARWKPHIKKPSLFKTLLLFTILWIGIVLIMFSYLAQRIDTYCSKCKNRLTLCEEINHKILQEIK